MTPIVQHRATAIAVYNLEVDSPYVYNVGVTGILVHNQCVYREVIEMGMGRKIPAPHAARCSRSASSIALRTLVALFVWSATIGSLDRASESAAGDQEVQSPLVGNQLPPALNRRIDFRTDVYPLLATRCFKCHQGPDASSGHRLDNRAELLGETNATPLVIPGRSAQSKIIRLVAGVEKDAVMPPQGKRLTPEEIGILRAWIDQGRDLAWDDSLLPPDPTATSHWSFLSIVRPPVPVPENAEHIRNPIDAFVAAERVRHGLAAAPPAAPHTLIRRLSFNLLGLPPSPEDLRQFLDDKGPDAYERLVDRLLASPHYGERWGRHWLDVARWAESEGYESNHPRPFAWRYRDYVVQSFNTDRPYDGFLRQQLAGDELTPYSDENLIATGFLAAARLSSNEEDKWLQRNAVLVDIVNTLGNAVLGLTINCAQCHNHKFDPITIRDYYRLQGFFLPGQPVNLALRDPELRQKYETLRPAEYEPTRELASLLFEKGRTRLIAERMKNLSPELRAAVETPTDKRTVPQELLVREADLRFQSTPNGIEQHIPEEDRRLYDELKKKLAVMEKTAPPEPQTIGFYSPVTSPHALTVLPMQGFYPLPFEPVELARRKPYLMIRGDVHQIGPVVETGWPAVFENKVPVAAAGGTREPATTSPGTARSRTALADWLTDRRHPLTARVWVNRIWQYHFGRGLVASANDFGLRGDPPSHPALLDWLACELIDSGWSTRHIQRLIVTSGTFRQSSQTSVKGAEIDSENRYLWHWSPRRLESEAIRDAMLAVTGELDRAIGGPAVSTASGNVRRSLYLSQKRGEPPELQKLFDGPSEMAESCAARYTSTTALQSLYLLNSPFVRARAESLAQRLIDEAQHDLARQIELAFLWTLGRSPEADERQQSLEFFVEQGKSAHDPAAAGNRPELAAGGAERSLLVAFCQALLNLNEFVYLE